ncbi:MAG: glutamate--cysteine ligase [Candidatus Accumulibacter sp.]|jgi:glutamate--cysteine ligase|nr:glutamate--cysteine ligase [Accumulibacter sp.]
MTNRITLPLESPLLDIEETFIGAACAIESWFRSQWIEHTPPFYGSVDLRNAGFKLAPIDMNLFPGGFNNLGPSSLPLCVQAVTDAIERVCADAKKLLLIPENHTRNPFYLQNVSSLTHLLTLAGLEVRVGSLMPEITAPTPFNLPDGNTLLVEPLVRDGAHLGLADFYPCAILLNNDLSSGIPDLLQNLDAPVILPPLHAGWATRRKSRHFVAYDEVANEFSRLVGVDPWRINPYFSVCSSVNFHERQGEECLAANVEAVLAMIREKYAEYGIEETPYVVVKADAGTYGMGVMTVKDASGIVGLNRKQRNKMSVIKEGVNVNQVIIQEGVHTHERFGSNTAEPVVYMIDRFVVGGFYRVHGSRGIDENLNAPGMYFEPVAFETSCSCPDQCKKPNDPPNRFYTYGILARLAHLAASIELEEEVE